MSRWKSYFAKSIYKLDAGVDRLKYRLSEKVSRQDVVVYPYLGYGTREKFYLKGRVLRAKSLQPAEPDSSLWENLKNAYKRFDSDEVPYAELKCYFETQISSVRADEEGFFETWLELDEALAEDHEDLQTVALELTSLKKQQALTQFNASIMVPRSDANFGIISDIDDTVLQTGATQLLSMVKKVIFGNAHTRLPFAGVAEFYQALHRDINPIFYVSSSPWNLYDVLLDFLDIQNIPLGPLLLRDWGISATEFLPTSHKNHKLEVIRQILHTYSLPFILIGDSGQEDPEIYADLVTEFSGRILAIYIRDVSESSQRGDQIQQLAIAVAKSGTDLILMPDTSKAWEHARAKTWIA